MPIDQLLELKKNMTRPHLKVGKIYHAESAPSPVQLGTDRDGNPRVFIYDLKQDPEKKNPYIGSIRKSKNTSPTLREEEDNLRKRIIEAEEEIVSTNVVILHEKSNTPIPYTVSCTLEPCYDPEPGKGALTAKEALRVVRSKRVFYGQTTGRGQDEDPFIKIFFDDNNEGKGYLIKEEMRYHRLKEKDYDHNKISPVARMRIMRDIELGRRIREDMKIGDRFLLRKVGINNCKNYLYFRPLINFTVFDAATDHKGESLVTRVEGLEPGNILFNLPVLFQQNDKQGNSYGVGYIERPNPRDHTEFYRKVWVPGGEKHIGNHIKALEIEESEKKIIARKVM